MGPRRRKDCCSGSCPHPMEAGESSGWDFLEWLDPDTSTCVFHRLDDPADLARAATVSRSWRRFVIANEFCKSLCLGICPEVATFTRAVEVSRTPPAAHASECSYDAETDHRIYSYLGGALVATEPSEDCILHCIGASSTDRFPDERMENTLEPRDRIGHRPSYWSSRGQHDPDVPESLTYRLDSDLCIVDEIRIRPFQVYFEYGRPICSSKMVRVRIGHSKLPPGSDEDAKQRVLADENYVWMYTSPEFLMLQLCSAFPSRCQECMLCSCHPSTLTHHRWANNQNQHMLAHENLPCQGCRSSPQVTASGPGCVGKGV